MTKITGVITCFLQIFNEVNKWLISKISFQLLEIIKVDFECNISIKGTHNNDKNKVKSQLPEEGVVCEVFVAVVEVVDPENLHVKAASNTTGITFLQGAKPSLMQAFFSLLLSLKLLLIVFLQSLTGLKSRTSMQAQYSVLDNFSSHFV